MIIKNSVKGVVCLCAFAISYFGFTGSKRTMKIAGEQITSVNVSIGLQAQAYCNEAMYPGEVNNGKCSGLDFESASRCFSATSGENCTGAHTP